ncbi:pyridoxal phosphate biosynthesis protein PdxJ [Luminiphilus syltensis NOR5-1B]|uniref:Pyridoxine 5'-phosphate synthase n=1 Tax=Luminiphilus syltensis NOR5-1B TaxID=565045 RepID=B8KQK5_9GAMM|nr:pyridoxine 5'-phosphate synthase [Luminiphilus syltensis]EED34119.1 pyridoxal phosphate biosynthesis protein PdxJ [Luminiphilus syltensis NOR5-1B]
MTILSINLNKIALIRNSRDTTIPDVLDHARQCIAAGAGGITVHPRPDQRHIRADDCRELKAGIDVELNIEGNPFAPPRSSDRAGVSDYPGFMALVEEVRPAQATLVPDGDAQLTSDHGFDLEVDGERLQPVIEQLKAWGCRVSLFMDPLPEAMAMARDAGADRIELYTERYARAHAAGDYLQALTDYQAAARAAAKVGLGVNAGHDLNLSNLPDFDIPECLEVSIGHAFTVDALQYGIERAIQLYLQALEGR